MAIGQTHDTPFQTDQALVNRVQLFDQRFDPVIVQMDGFEARNNRVLNFGIFAPRLRGQILALHLGVNQLSLQFVKGLEISGDGIQLGHHAFAQFGLHGRDRQIDLVVIIVVIVVTGFAIFGGFPVLGGVFVFFTVF